MQKVISSLTYLAVQRAMQVLTKRKVETFNAIISYEEKDLKSSRQSVLKDISIHLRKGLLTDFEK